MKNINLTAIILTKNEEENIDKCLKSLKFCDEVIVVDDYSRDKTVEIAKKNGAKVYFRDLRNSFSDQRNFGISKANGRWVLFIDADEIITPRLRNEILKEVKKKINYISGYFFKRIDYVWGREVKHGEIGDVRLLRLARKNAGRFIRSVHEYWHIIGQTKNLKNPIKHYPHPKLWEFLDEVNFRSTLHAKANMDEGKRSSLAILIFYPIYKFIYAYVFRFGFLDGIPGFVIATVMSFHSFLSWSKLWFLQKS